jgi:hypothetical protein
VSDAVSLDALREGRARLRRALEAVPSLPLEHLDADELRRVACGMAIPAHVSGSRAALVDEADALVAVAEREGDYWRPRVVLRDAEQATARRD